MVTLFSLKISIPQKEVEAAYNSYPPDILKNSSENFLKSYGLTPMLQTISINCFEKKTIENSAYLVYNVGVNKKYKVKKK